MTELIRFFSVQIALLAVVLISHSYIGLHIIRRTLIFSDLVLYQLAAAGIGLGVEYGTFQSYMSPMVAVLFGALLLALIKPKKESNYVANNSNAWNTFSCLHNDGYDPGAFGYSRTQEGNYLH